MNLGLAKRTAKALVSVGIANEAVLKSNSFEVVIAGVNGFFAEKGRPAATLIESNALSAAMSQKRSPRLMLRGKQATVIVAGGGRIFDAAHELSEWMSEREALGIPASAPLFCHASGAMITVDELRDVVKAAMEAAGRDPRRYGAHSLRIGGATAALAAGVPPQLIRLLGRWSSDVYQIYCRMSSQAAIAAGQQLASAEVDTVEGGFHEEHLELLPAEVSAMRAAVDGEADEQMGGEDEA
jgi:hypothetical protein